MPYQLSYTGSAIPDNLKSGPESYTGSAIPDNLKSGPGHRNIMLEFKRYLFLLKNLVLTQ